jgi:hypothetical protein
MNNEDLIDQIYDEAMPLAVIASNMQTIIVDRDNWKSTAELLYAFLSDLRIPGIKSLDDWYENGRISNARPKNT